MTQTLDKEDTPPPMPLSWRMLGSGEPITERKIGSHSAREAGRSRAWKTMALDVPPRMKTAGSFFCGMDHLGSVARQACNSLAIGRPFRLFRAPERISVARRCAEGKTVARRRRHMTVFPALWELVTGVHPRMPEQADRWIPVTPAFAGAGKCRDDKRRTPMRTTTRLKEIVARRAAVPAPGTANALFARVIEELGFEVVYVTGAGIANMHLGAPDIGLTTLTEIANAVAAIADAVALPLIVDADTGFGNAVNMVRTVRVLERAGAAGLQIEDQVFPKKCGHFAGKEVIPLDEMVQKVKAAVDARRDGDLQIIARTDARAVEGLDSAIARAHAYIDAGADIAFVEAPTSLAELARVTREIKAPHVANIVFGGKTPDPGRAELAKIGFSLVLYANAALQAAVKATIDVLGALKRDGSLDGVAAQLVSFEERQRVVQKPAWDALEARFRSTSGKASG